MARPALRIEVSSKDQKDLRKLISGGVQQVRVVLRALALLQLAKGAAARRIAGGIPLTAQAIRNRRYQQGGLYRALYEKQRPGAAEVLDESQKQRLIAMVCTSPPEGRARWTVRLVAQEAVKRELVPRVGQGNYPDTSSELRPEAVAGKKYGWWPISMTPISPRWKTCWRSTNDRTTRSNRWSV
jgi:putative transposase